MASQITQILAVIATAFSDFVSISKNHKTPLIILSPTQAASNEVLYAPLFTIELISSKAWITSGYLSGDCNMVAIYFPCSSGFFTIKYACNFVKSRFFSQIFN
jgi:hypothetical protein